MKVRPLSIGILSAINGFDSFQHQGQGFGMPCITFLAAFFHKIGSGCDNVTNFVPFLKDPQIEDVVNFLLKIGQSFYIPYSPMDHSCLFRVVPLLKVVENTVKYGTNKCQRRFQFVRQVIHRPFHRLVQVLQFRDILHIFQGDGHVIGYKGQ